ERPESPCLLAGSPASAGLRRSHRRRANRAPLPASRAVRRARPPRPRKFASRHDTQSNLRGKVRAMRAFLRLFGLVLLSSTLCSCAVPFYWQAINGQWELIRKRTPIEDVLADPDQAEDVMMALGKVPMIRRFAVEELRLPRHGSSDAYVDL